MNWPELSGACPTVVVIAGPNGAGKTTFFHAHLAECALPFVNADDLALELGVDAYEAASLAAAMREDLVRRGESFVFETVFSDPVGAKVAFLQEAGAKGYQVILVYIKIDSVEQSRQRVAMRVMQGGHDVPDEKLEQRFARSLRNLERAMETLPQVVVYDHSDLRVSFHLDAVYRSGVRVEDK